jgi:hypothetical protein
LFGDEQASAAAALPSARRAAGAGAGAQGDRDALRRHLDRLLGGRLRTLVLTDNRTRILTVRPAQGGGRPPSPGGGPAAAGLDLRLHRCFLSAPQPVLAQVAAFCEAAVAPLAPGASGRRRRALATIRDHFERHRRGARAPRPVATRTRGRRFDLAAIRDELNHRHFDGRLTAAITWGRGRPGGRRSAWRCRRRRFSIQLGSYSFEDDLIRIHPALDRPEVPDWVVAAIVYHELLHAAIPPQTVGGRRRVHTPEFRRREAAFPDHRRAERWLADNLARLVTGG